MKNPLRNNIGSVSSATMRPEDLIPAFIDCLESQKPLKREHRKLIRDIRERMDPGTNSGRQCACIHYEGKHRGDCLECECPKFKIRTNQAGEQYPEREESYFDSEDAAEDVNDLFDALDNYCLPYLYFGAHPGDGADYGFWLSEEWQEDFDGIVESCNGFKTTFTQNGREIDGRPKGYSGPYAYINDHGNITLYSYSRGRGREIWSLV